MFLTDCQLLRWNYVHILKFNQFCRSRTRQTRIEKNAFTNWMVANYLRALKIIIAMDKNIARAKSQNTYSNEHWVENIRLKPIYSLQDSQSTYSSILTLLTAVDSRAIDYSSILDNEWPFTGWSIVNLHSVPGLLNRIEWIFN